MNWILFMGLLLTLLSVATYDKKRQVLGALFIGWAEALQDVRLWLDEMSQPNDPRNYSRLIGTLNWLLSGANHKTIQTEYRRQSMGSEFRQVDVRYTGHKCEENLVTDDTAATCDAVAQRRDAIQTVSPTLYAEDKFTLTEQYMRENKENGRGIMERFRLNIRDSMRICRESMDSQIFAKLGAGVGANPAGGIGAGNYKDIEMIIGSSGKIDDRNWDVIKNEQEDNYQIGELGILGLGNARRYMNRLAVGNANDNGVDYREVLSEFGMALFKDHYTTTALGGANRVLAISPGLCQFYNYNLFDGDFEIDEGWKKGPGISPVRTTLPDPILPINWDIQIRYNDGCSTGLSNGHHGAYTVRIWSWFDVLLVNEMAWGDTYCGLNDFNGIVGYNITES